MRGGVGTHLCLPRGHGLPVSGRGGGTGGGTGTGRWGRCGAFCGERGEYDEGVGSACERRRDRRGVWSLCGERVCVGSVWVSVGYEDGVGFGCEEWGIHMLAWREVCEERGM